MDFLKKRVGILAALIISVATILAVVWFCLFGLSKDVTRDGTLVQMPANMVSGSFRT